MDRASTTCIWIVESGYVPDSNAHIIFSQPFFIEVDACETSIGAALSQQGHLVAYLSRASGVNNQKLTIYEKKFMAIMKVLDKRRAYL
jgi:hypothetical protein